MHDAPRLAAPSARAKAALGLALGAAAIACLLAGRTALSILVAVIVALSYVDLRRLLGPWGHPMTFVLGAAGAVGFLWPGYNGRLVVLPSIGAGLTLALLASHVVLHEARVRNVSPTMDVSATLSAAAVAGVLGAHVLLIRSIPRFGFRGTVVFAVMVVSNDFLSFAVSARRASRRLPAATSSRTWLGTFAGLAASLVTGIVAGLVADPPFTIRSGLALGAAMGVLTPLGKLAFSVIRRGVTTHASDGSRGPITGVLGAVDAVLFAAPAFYWAFRTLAL